MSSLSKKGPAPVTPIVYLATVLKVLSADKTRYYWHLNPETEDEIEGIHNLLHLEVDETRRLFQLLEFGKRMGRYPRS